MTNIIKNMLKKDYKRFSLDEIKSIINEITKLSRKTVDTELLQLCVNVYSLLSMPEVYEKTTVEKKCDFNIEPDIDLIYKKANSNMPFNWAISELLNSQIDCAVAREDWSGNIVYIKAYKERSGENNLNGHVEAPYLFARTVDGTLICGWTPTQEDIFAKDWYTIYNLNDDSNNINKYEEDKSNVNINN